MTEKGFVAIARGMLDHPVVGVSTRKAFTKTEAWLWLLFEAAYRPRRYQAGIVVVELQRGQLAHTTRYMANAWHWPETNVRRFLERLKTGAGTGAMIGAESGPGTTIITICNYDLYQTPHNATGAESGAPNGAGTGAKVAQQRRRKEQSNKETKELSRSRAREPEGFSEWYNTYPVKAQPKAAELAFAKVIKAGEISLEDLMARTRAFAARQLKRPENERRYIPYAAKWLDSGGYLDEPEAAGRKANGAGLQIEAPTLDPRSFTDADWQYRLAILNGGEWPLEFWGPPPGTPGCLISPADVAWRRQAGRYQCLIRTPIPYAR
jgi:hypothetical protein